MPQRCTERPDRTSKSGSRSTPARANNRAAGSVSRHEHATRHSALHRSNQAIQMPASSTRANKQTRTPLHQAERPSNLTASFINGREQATRHPAFNGATKRPNNRLRRRSRRSKLATHFTARHANTAAGFKKPERANTLMTGRISGAFARFLVQAASGACEHIGSDYFRLTLYADISLNVRVE